MRIPTCQTANTVPVPPPLPHVLPSRRIPAYTDIPTPPPLPQNLMGTRLPTCIDTLSNAPDLENSVNETTRQISNEVQRQEDIPQDLRSTDSSTENQKH